ncbi:peroxidase 43, partial [Dorcoceras hygrometricum]
LILTLLGIIQGQLQVGFYASTCPDAEAIVTGIVRAAFSSDQTTAPALLRLHFHDCFVQGCEGSIMIDNGKETDEKKAFEHQGVRGFDVIEMAKSQLESACPGVVSCADIVALAARDAIVLAKGPSYEVETGRRDGMVSDAKTAEDMPAVTDSIQKLKHKFLEKGLTEKDLVILSGNYVHHHFFTLTSVGGSGSDPSVNPEFLSELKSMCPQNGDVNVRLPMDRGSGQTFDNQILQNIRGGFAVLQSDSSLYQDGATQSLVDSYFASSGPSFEADFADSIVKLGRTGVLTGAEGTIRAVCKSF